MSGVDRLIQAADDLMSVLESANMRDQGDLTAAQRHALYELQRAVPGHTSKDLYRASRIRTAPGAVDIIFEHVYPRLLSARAISHGNAELLHSGQDRTDPL